MKRGAVAFVILAALIFSAAPSRAAYPTPTKLKVNVSDVYFLNPGHQISGSTDPLQLVEVRVLTPRLRVKALRRTLATADGSFSVWVGSPYLESGDRVDVMLGGNPDWTYGMLYSRVRITALDSAAGTISGVVTPRRPRVACLVTGRRVIPDPATVAKLIGVSWQAPGAGKPTDAAGRFTIKPTLVGLGWEGRYRRNDEVLFSYDVFPVAGNANFSFKARFYNHIPGLQAIIGQQRVALIGIAGRNHVATLVGQNATTKAVVYATVSFGGSYFTFFNAAGVPVSLASGDTLRVDGFNGFTAPVPRLGGTVGATSNRVHVTGPPNARIQVSYDRYDDTGNTLPSPPSVWVKTDAAGRATAAPAADLRVGDEATLDLIDDAGHWWRKEVQCLPAP